MRTPDVFKSTTLGDLQTMVAAIAEYAPELDTRAARAVVILLNGKVAEVGTDQYEVVSTDCDGSYRVDMAAQTCDCPDFTHRAPVHKGQRWCKHRLAVAFLRKLVRSRNRATPRQARVATFRRCATARRRAA